jgi:hypothetical protein
MDLVMGHFPFSYIIIEHSISGTLYVAYVVIENDWLGIQIPQPPRHIKVNWDFFLLFSYCESLSLFKKK